MSGPGGGSGFEGSNTSTPELTISDGTIFIKEQSNAETDKSGYGQLWVKTGSPGDLYYTNENGDDVRMTNDDEIAAAAGAAVAADDINAGDAAVSISTTSGNITLVNSLTASDGLLIPDDTTLRFGAGAGDATIEYDENGTDELRFAGAAATFEQDVTFDNNVTLGVAATDVTTVTGHLTASHGVHVPDQVGTPHGFSYGDITSAGVGEVAPFVAESDAHTTLYNYMINTKNVSTARCVLATRTYSTVAGQYCGAILMDCRDAGDTVVRAVSLKAVPTDLTEDEADTMAVWTTTIAGTEREIFAFGDIGSGSQAASVDGILYVGASDGQVGGAITASNSIEIRAGQTNRALIVTGSAFINYSSSVSAVGSYGTDARDPALHISGGYPGLLIESQPQAETSTEPAGTALLVLKDGGGASATSSNRYYIQALDSNDDIAWTLGDSGHGDTNLNIANTATGGWVSLHTTASTGGSIAFKPKASTALCLNDDGTAEFSGSVLIQDDKKIIFGAGSDASIEYDENGTDQLRFAGASVIFENDVQLGSPAKSSGKRLHVLEAAAGYTAVFESPTGPGLQLSSSTDNDNQADWLIQGLGQATDGLGGRIRLYSNAASKEMFFLTATGSNISIGQDALSLITAGGTNNIAIGKDAGNDLTTGDNNVFIGYEAGDKTADADKTVIIGAGAAGGVITSDADGTVAVGYAAGAAITSGQTNTAIGAYALDACTDSDANTAVGYQALTALTGQAGNTGNTAVGSVAGAAITSGQYNTAVGAFALDAEDDGDSCVAVGYAALGAQTGVSNEVGNTAVGALAGTTLTEAVDCTLVGLRAGTAVTTGSYNVAVGSDALKTETGGSGSVAIGAGALYTQNYVASDNKYLWGGDHGHMNNIGIGYSAGYAITTGSNNIAIGANALLALTVGHGVTAIGSNALGSYVPITWGDDDVYGGTFYRPSAGTTAVGENAGYYVTTGLDNTFIGNEAGAGTYGQGLTGNFNICVGSNSGNKLRTNAGGNVIVGAFAGYSYMGNGAAITTGDSNVLVGSLTDASAADAQNQIVIGYNITGGEDSQLTFGKASNIVQNEFDTDAAWTRTSDRRKKRNIQDDGLGLDFINKLRTVTHQWKPSNEFPKEWNEYSEENNMNLSQVMHGMIAQEVKQALNEVGCETFGGWKERQDGSQVLSREMFVTPLIKAVQELSAKVAELEAKLENQ